MRWLWVVVVLSAFFWLATVPMFTPPTPGWIWLVAASILLAGAGLRKASIDEIPQLVNVLKGDMSLVGPRPHPVEEVKEYTTWQKRRLSMRPGITGLWQVGGRSSTTFAESMKHDLDYIDNWSLWLDLKILSKTLPAVLSSRGAS